MSDLVLLFKSAVKSLLVVIPAEFTVKSIGLDIVNTSLSSEVVDQKVLYL